MAAGERAGAAPRAAAPGRELPALRGRGGAAAAGAPGAPGPSRPLSAAGTAPRSVFSTLGHRGDVILGGRSPPQTFLARGKPTSVAGSSPGSTSQYASNDGFIQSESQAWSGSQVAEQLRMEEEVHAMAMLSPLHETSLPQIGTTGEEDNSCPTTPKAGDSSGSTNAPLGDPLTPSLVPPLPPTPPMPTTQSPGGPPLWLRPVWSNRQPLPPWAGPGQGQGAPVLRPGELPAPPPGWRPGLPVGMPQFAPRWPPARPPLPPAPFALGPMRPGPPPWAGVPPGPGFGPPLPMMNSMGFPPPFGANAA
mmetsp:Transcript_74265/g.170225  ORF Transcript_74265/g.170225 Transcript_74265/m.170225 type:complete len:306 (-) Transcript_74265:56-973(-)